jgi:hypothetical protein
VSERANLHARRRRLERKIGDDGFWDRGPGYVIPVLQRHVAVLRDLRALGWNPFRRSDESEEAEPS